MSQPVNLLTRSSGLNVVVDPVRLQYDPQAGQQELAAAFNVDIDQTGRVSRRKGYELLNPTPCHSVWHGAGRTLCVADGSICVVNENWTFTPLTAVAHVDERVWFLDVNGDVFWGNGFEIGILRSGLDPETWSLLYPTQDEDTRDLQPLPVGKCLDLYNGRIYLAKDNALFFSEPLAYQAFDPARNWIPFDGDICMVRHVVDGLYVGTSKGVFFLMGSTVQEMRQTMVSKSPPIEGTCSYVDGRNIMDGRSSTAVVMWTAHDGIYVGYSSGQAVELGAQAINVTKDKLRFPVGTTGSAVAHDDVYLSLIDP